MSTSQWLLDRVARHRTRLEHSFTTALHELKQLQKERQAKRPARNVPAPHTSHAMSDAAEDHPAFCAPATTDSR
jgi:hypothetical protein